MSLKMSAAMDAAALAKFREQGFYAPLPIMSEDTARGYRARLEESERQRGHPLSMEEKKKPHLLFSWAAELIRHPAILDAVETVLGPDILVWDSVVLTKEAGGREHLTWHQDLLYWGLDPADGVVTAWIALSPATVESGCMRMVPGSHKMPLAPHANTFAPDNLLGRGQEIQVDVNEADAVDVVLRPGEISLHHVMIIHSSDRNRSSDRRIGYAIRYVAANVRQTAPAPDCALLVRGVDRYGYFDQERVPSTYDSPEAEAVHAEASNKRRAVKKVI